MEKLLSTQHVADILGLHIKTLQKKLRYNDIALRFVRLSPRKVGFRPSDVERYIAAHEVSRDGSGIKKRKPNLKAFKAFMTDQEAQAFFDGIERDTDGVLLANNGEK